MDIVDFGALVQPGDEGAHVAKAAVNGVELVGQGLVGMVDAVAERIEAGVDFVAELVEFLFREELGFYGSLAHKLFAKHQDGQGGDRAGEPGAEGAGARGGKLSEESGIFYKR